MICNIVVVENMKQTLMQVFSFNLKFTIFYNAAMPSKDKRFAYSRALIYSFDSFITLSRAVAMAEVL